MEDESYSILNQRAIIDLLIQGDIFPYMTGSEIQDIGMKFGVSYEEGSRWKISPSTTLAKTSTIIILEAITCF